jgi:acyl carrier protein
MEIRDRILNLVNAISGESKKIYFDEPILENGLIDSVGILELISELEAMFNVEFFESDMQIENFETILKIEELIIQKIENN